MPGRTRHHSRRIVPLAFALALLLALLSPLAASAAAPSLVARHAVVLDADTGKTLLARDGATRVAPASLTKIMTAMVALERADPAGRITVTPQDLIGEASMGLRAGETLTLATLLYGLLLPSGNDAAMAIARGVGAQAGDANGAQGVARFVGWMNETAARLALRDSRFANPHGLDAPGHHSSAADLARLTAAAWGDPVFARIFGSPSYQAEGHALRHGHRLVGNYDGVIGGKTGLTDGCGFCLVTAAEHAGRRIVVVVLRDTIEGAFADTRALLDWTYTQLDAEFRDTPPAPSPVPTPSPVPSAAPPAPPPAPTATPRAPATAGDAGATLRLRPAEAADPGRLPWPFIAALALTIASVVVWRVSG